MRANGGLDEVNSNTRLQPDLHPSQKRKESLTKERQILQIWEKHPNLFEIESKFPPQRKEKELKWMSKAVNT